MQDGRTNLLLVLAFLLGAVATGLLLGLAGSGATRLALTVGAGAGIFGLGLGIGGLYVGLVAARRRPAKRSAAHRPRTTPASIGEALPTVTDYYRNAPDGEPLRRATYPGRRLPDSHWLRDSESTEHPDRADA